MFSISAYKLPLSRLVILSIAAIIFFTCACQSKPDASKTKLVIDGASSFYLGVEKASSRFRVLNKDIALESVESGSKQGIKNLLAGTADIARISFPLSAEQISQAKQSGIDLEQVKIGYDAIAIVAHPERARNFKGMTFSQAEEIFFKGTVTEWSAIDANQHGTISVVLPDPAVSGTISWLSHLLTGDEKSLPSSQAKLLRSPSQLREQARRNPSVLTILPLGYLDDSVGTIAVGPDVEHLVECTRDHITNGRYPLVRPLYLATRGTPVAASKLFIDFLLSVEGQSILSTHGILSLDQVTSESAK